MNAKDFVNGKELNRLIDRVKKNYRKSDLMKYDLRKIFELEQIESKRKLSEFEQDILNELTCEFVDNMWSK